MVEFIRSEEPNMALEMTSDEFKAIIDARGDTYEAFAGWLNGELGRSYDKARISRWAKGAENIPQPVIVFLKNYSTSNNSMKPLKKAPARSLHVTRIIAVVNQKGGVAKTTTSINLAAALAQRRKRVLLIDFDAQANATLGLGVNFFEVEKSGRSIYHALLKDIEISDILLTQASDGRELGFTLAPSSESLALADIELLNETMGELILREKLLPIKDDYDFILIDCPPNLGQITTNALSAADTVLIPSQPETFSVFGINQLLKVIGKIRGRVNPTLQVFGILPTLFAKGIGDHQAGLEMIHDSFGDRFTIFRPIPRTTVFSNCTAAGIPAVIAKPKATGVDAYFELADRLIDYTKRAGHE